MLRQVLDVPWKSGIYTSAKFHVLVRATPEENAELDEDLKLVGVRDSKKKALTSLTGYSAVTS